MSALDVYSEKVGLKESFEGNERTMWGTILEPVIADQFFESLDGPVRRVASKDSHVGFSPYLENAILPQSEEIVTVAEELLEY